MKKNTILCDLLETTYKEFSEKITQETNGNLRLRNKVTLCSWGFEISGVLDVQDDEIYLYTIEIDLGKPEMYFRDSVDSLDRKFKDLKGFNEVFEDFLKNPKVISIIEVLWGYMENNPNYPF